MVCPTCGARNDDTAQVCFTCRAILAVLTRGSVVGGRYEILDLLGRGGMGIVYKVRDRTLDETVALKVLRPEIAGRPDMAARFHQEIRLARQVRHPNVRRIHDVGMDNAIRYIAMDWIDGTSLKQTLRDRGALPESECLDVALQVAEGLRAIHAAGIVHRDLTTPNIMLGADGVAHILDFGIAKQVTPEGGAHPTAAGYVMGSPEYMSPEQAQGRPVDHRTDIYSFGVVLFEMTTGAVPFRGETPVATLLLHVDTPPPLGDAAIPRALTEVLRRALAKDPRDRYQSTDDLIDALRSAAGGTVAATTDSRSPQSDTPQQGRRALALTATALGLGLAVGWAFLTVRANRERPPHPIAAGDSEPSRPSPPAPSPSESHSPDRNPLVTPSARPATPGPAEFRTPSVAPAHRPALPSASPDPPPPSPEARDFETRAGSTPRPPDALRADTASPRPEAANPTAGPSPREGALLVLVTPWANVAIDGTDMGQTPLARLPLAPGPHAVVLTHPDYQPFPRRVVIRPGETVRLTFAFAVEGVRKRR